MHVWIVTIGEPLPLGDRDGRLLRSGILAKKLISRGHEVTRWASTFDHSLKKHYYQSDTFLDPDLNQPRVNLIHSISYRKNISVRRIINHVHLARKFRRYASLAAPPDLIICSLPTIELSFEATKYAAKNKIPIVLDVRDRWPDIFTDVVPRWLRPVAAVTVSPLVRLTRRALSGATSIVGISPSYLDWALRHADRSKRDSDGVYPLGYQRSLCTEDQLDAATIALRKSGIDTEKTICWFIGSFGRTYDLVTVIDAARRLRADGRTDFQFVLSGTGENVHRLTECAGGLDNVVFTGWINSLQIAALSRMACIGLMAYAEGAPQGLPNKLFEYMSAGMPILSSLKGETEILLRQEQCGLTYTAGDSECFAAALIGLADDGALRNRMGANASGLFESKFDAGKIYLEMSEFVESLVKSANPAIRSEHVTDALPATMKQISNDNIYGINQ